jgi:hypothetical protein
MEAFAERAVQLLMERSCVAERFPTVQNTRGCLQICNMTTKA